jgi:hypothetical protein
MNLRQASTFLLLKNATTATSHPVFEASKLPLRKSPNLQIANPLYLCRFPDDSRRQATTDYSGLNPTLSAMLSLFLFIPIIWNDFFHRNYQNVAITMRIPAFFL